MRVFRKETLDDVTVSEGEIVPFAVKLPALKGGASRKGTIL